MDAASSLSRADTERSLLAALAADPTLAERLASRLSAELFACETVTWHALAAARRGGRPPQVPAGWTPAPDPEKALAVLEDLAGRRNDAPTGTAIPMTSLFPDVANRTARQQRLAQEMGTGTAGIPSGFRLLDRELGGLQRGLHLLAGPPGIGKTTLAVHVTLAAASAGFPVLYLTFDEEPGRLVLRALCQQGELDAKGFTDGVADPAAIERVMAEEQEVFRLVRVLRGSPDMKSRDVEAEARRLMAAHQAETCLVVVDYVQLWAAGTRDFTEFRHEVAGLVSALHDMAQALDSPVLAITSQNRAGQGTSELTSLEGTSDLEYSADSVIFLVAVQASGRTTAYDPYDEDTRKTRMIDLVLRKNRYGPTASTLVRFRPDLGRFSEG